MPNATLARNVCSHGILLRDAIELWGTGASHEDCIERIAAYPRELKIDFFRPDVSWRIDVETYGSSMSLRELKAAPVFPYQCRLVKVKKVSPAGKTRYAICMPRCCISKGLSIYRVLLKHSISSTTAIRRRALNQRSRLGHLRQLCILED